jgi:GAF domain-containing protein
LRESIRRLRLSEEATSALATALSARDVADVLLAFGERELGSAAGVVYFTREDETKLHFQGARGVPLAGQIPVLTPDLPVPLATAVKQRQAVWLESYDQLLEKYPNLAKAETPRECLQSVVAMPLMHAGRLVGGVALSFQSARVFEESERKWLTNFAAHCALAAERARLYEAEKQARAEAETLVRITESLNAAQLDLEVLVQRVTDEATALVGASFGAFFYNVTNERGESYVLYVLSGAPKEAFAKFGLPRNTPIFAPTFAGEAIVRLADVRNDPRYGTMAPHFGMPEGHLPVVSYLAVPVISRTGSVIGGLFFGQREPDRFTEQHERMVKALAAGAAAAIDNAQLFRATREAEEGNGAGSSRRLAQLRTSKPVSLFHES